VLPPGLQALRALRLLRLLRLERLVRFSRHVFSFEGIRLAALLALLGAVAGGFAFTGFERQQTPKPSFFDGFWWAMSTMTTVGYGDFVPKTTGGRIVAILLMMIGITFVALLTGAVAQRFVAPAVSQVELGVEAVEAGEDLIAAEISEIRSRLDRLEALLQRPR
jgi:voltage-gated potassium channel